MKVSAVVVTRGDVDLEPLLRTIPYDDVVVWDNSTRPFDARIYGRYLAAFEAKEDMCFFVDDDVFFYEHERLEEAWEPGLLVSNMDDGWIRAGGYEDVRLLGAGSIASKYVLWEAIERYHAAGWPLDEAFTYEVDFVVGVLAESKRVDLGYTIRPDVSQTGRLGTQEWQLDLKRQFMDRARAIRDRQASYPASEPKT